MSPPSSSSAPLRRAAEGDLAAAGELAADAVALLPPGADRDEVLASAVQLLNSAGESLRKAGAWPQAAGAHERALALVEETHAAGVEIAVVAQNLAVTYKYTGRFSDAARLYERALTTAEAAGDDHLVATICHNLGGLAHARGDAAAGVPWARRSMRCARSLNDPVALAGDRGALAGLLIDLGGLDRSSRAPQHGARTVRSPRRRNSRSPSSMATWRRSRWNEATSPRRSTAAGALAGKERALGPTSPDLAVTLTTLRFDPAPTGRDPGSGGVHRRAHAVLRSVVEATHPLLRTITANLTAAQDSRLSR